MSESKRKPGSAVRRRRDARPRALASGRSFMGGFLGHCAGGLLVMLVLAAAAVGVMYVRLAHGPASLRFLVPMIERGITDELSGVSAKIDDALVALTDKGQLEFRLVNLRLVEGDGDTVASVPSAAVQMSRKALLRLQLVPSRIDILEAKVALSYTKDNGLAMSFSRDAGEEAAADGRPLRPAGRLNGTLHDGTGHENTVAAGQAGGSETSKPFNLGRLISEATIKARERLENSSYLKQVGLRDVVVLLDNLGVKSQWHVADGVLEISHTDNGSSVLASLQMASDRGPWSIRMRSAIVGGSDVVQIEAAVNRFIPKTLGRGFPQLSLLESVDAPIDADAKLTLAAAAGVVTGGKLDIDIGRGQVALPEIGEVPFPIDRGRLELTYDGARRRFDVSPSTFAWGNSRITIAGIAAAEGGASDWWTIELASADGQFAADEFGVKPAPVEQGTVKARLSPSTGQLLLDQLAFRVGTSQFSSRGHFIAAASAAASGAMFEAALGPTPAETLKVLWPRAFASGARTWVGDRIKRGTVKTGTLRYLSGKFAAEQGVVGVNGQPPRRFTLAMEATDLSSQPLRWLQSVEAPRALVRLENNTLEVAVPDAFVPTGPNRKVPIKTGRFFIGDLNADTAEGEITFKAQSALVPVLDLLDQSPLHLIKGNGFSTDGVDGKVDGQVKLTLPLIADLDAKAVKIEAKAKISDGKAKGVLGAADVQGASINVDVSEAAVSVAGDLLANGVPVKLGWQRILEDNGERQPPLRLSATLDNADRAHLGMDTAQIVSGVVPVEILVERAPGEEASSVKLRADLTNAEIALDSIAWRKAPGRPVSLGADIVRGKANRLELQNLKVAGDDVTIEGSLVIGADNRLREVILSSFALNVVSRLEVNAQLKADAADKAGVWHVKVKGPTFDARELFRSLFTVGAQPDKAIVKPQKQPAGMELEAEIDNVLGHSEVSLRGLKLKLSRRGDRITVLDARGSLDGGGPVIVSMVPEANQPRRLQADTSDAGQALKLVGFYPNMQGGRARLELNVDGRGAAEKTGVLWVEGFRILGDPIVAEVLGSEPGAPEAGRPVRRKKTLERETIEFDRMKVPFSAGYGQFVIENAYMRGPLLGVNLVGKADFKTRSVNIGGTYIPLQGLNNALGEVPILGAIVSGPKGDGVFGITFAVQGPMAQPQVIVNPLSIAAPGIFREIFQMTNPDPKVVPRGEERQPGKAADQRAKASSSAAQSAGSDPDRAAGDVVDGWSSQTLPAKPRRQ